MEYVHKQTINFRDDRTPLQRRVSIGYEGDNLVERLEFVLPELVGGQVAKLMITGADAVTLNRIDDGRYAADLTREMIGPDGKRDAYVRIDGVSGQIWQSGPLRIVTGKLPDVEEEIEKVYPTAVGQMLTAMAEHTGEMEAQEQRVERAAQRAEDAAERAETGGGGSGGPGEDGGYYQPSVTGGVLTWTPSKADMPSVPSSDVRGPAGQDGQPGKDGKSAYQYAQDGGYTGTEAEFAAKLAEEVYSKEETDAAIVEATKEDKYELIETVNIEDDTVNTIDRTEEPNGTAYNFKKVYVEVKTPYHSTDIPGVIGLGGNYITYAPRMVSTIEAGFVTKCYIEVDCGMLKTRSFGTSNSDYSQASQTFNLYQRTYGGFMLDAITVVRVLVVGATDTFPIGTVINIWGVRA